MAFDLVSMALGCMCGVVIVLLVLLVTVIKFGFDLMQIF